MPDRFIGLLEPIKFPHTAKNGNDFGNVMQQIMVDACVVAGGKSYGTYRLDNIPRSDWPKVLKSAANRLLAS